MINKILNNKNKEEALTFFNKIIKIGVDFKLQKMVKKRNTEISDGLKLISPLPERGESLDNIIKEFENEILPYCTNFSSPNFMGFPDAGNSIASLGGSVLYNFLQQNLINQSFCAPVATFIEISVLRWLREIVGYKNPEVKDVWDAGGIITPGGTSSNAIAVLLARENKFPGTMEKGVKDPGSCKLIVPKGISHYSVKSGQMWAGCGDNLVEVETNNFRYDLDKLKKALKKNKNQIMSVVAYAGDSRTMTIDNFKAIHDIVKSIDPNIWLHADACHGFSTGLSKMLKHKINGIELFDSIATDPHKVLATPYVISSLLVKDTYKLKTIISKSDLIMQEPFSFGQITPFLGSRSWTSLKLWFMIKNFGKNGLDDLITKRHKIAVSLYDKLQRDNSFITLNKVEINSVMFMYKNKHIDKNIKALNEVNKMIYKAILKNGEYLIHQFSIPDSGRIKKGEILYPLRFMSGNPNITKRDLNDMIKHVKNIGDNCYEKYKK